MQNNKCIAADLEAYAKMTVEILKLVKSATKVLDSENIPENVYSELSTINGFINSRIIDNIRELCKVMDNYTSNFSEVSTTSVLDDDVKAFIYKYMKEVE